MTLGGVVLVTLLGYFGLLLFAIVGPKGWQRKLLAVGLLLSPILYLTADWPLGYWRFKKACSEEGGLRWVGVMDGPARVIRFDASLESGVEIRTDDAKRILKTYDWLEAIEGTSPELGTSSPPAYVRYELVKSSAGSRPGPNLVDPDLNVSQIDRIETQRGLVVEPGLSSADYVVRRADMSRPTRLLMYQFVLQRVDGRTVATATDITYEWSSSQKSILGQSIGTSHCPGGWDSSRALRSLLAMTNAKP